MTLSCFKYQVMVLVLVLFQAPLFGESEVLLEQKNEYGGKTVEVSYGSGDRSSASLDSSLIYFDKDGNVAKTVGRLNSRVAGQTKISAQEQLFQDGRTIAYKIYPTEDGKKERGYDYVMEWVNDKDVPIRSVYGKNGTEVVDGHNTFMSNYPFYRIQFIKDMVLEGENPKQSGDVISFSAKFNSGRAFVSFSSDPLPMDDVDFEIAGHYFAARGIRGGLDHYHKKATVVEDGCEFTLYLQDGLLPFVQKEKLALVSFVAIGFNGEIYPLITGMVDIKQ